MSWTDTHRRWRALQDIESRANAALRAGEPMDELPWTPAYAEIFGDRDGLADALRHRWDQARRAQLDTELPEAELERQWLRLHRQHAGVLRVLSLYDEHRSLGGQRVPG